MREEIVDIATSDGTMETFVCRPERGGPHPPIFFLMDAPGIRDELHDMARRLATVGYFVMLPNLYYRAGRDTRYGPDVLDSASPDHKRMRAVRTRMTIPPVMDDIGVLLDYTTGHDEAADGPAGTHGYCMSGPYALAAAARYPDRIAAAASFHGTWLVSDAEESPHRTFAKTRGELYISCAEHDAVAPLDMVEELRGYFEASGGGRRAGDSLRRPPRVRVSRALVLRQTRRGTALGAADRPVSPASGALIVNRSRTGARGNAGASSTSFIQPSGRRSLEQSTSLRREASCRP